MVRVRGFLSAILLCLALISVGFAKGVPGKRVKGQLLVQHHRGAKQSTLQGTVAAHGGKVKGQIKSLDVMVLEVPEHNLDVVKRALERSGKFVYVEPNYIAQVVREPDDPQFTYQWHLDKIAAPAAWSQTVGSSGVPIAIVDSGVDGGHVDLSGKLMAGWSFLCACPDTSDLHGHGTATAGVAAAVTNNTVGVAGVAWSNPILPLVAANSSGTAYYFHLADAIVYAADQGVRIISISIAGGSSSKTLDRAVKYAWRKGSVVFAAAGNNASSTPEYPAASPNVVAVASTGQTDSRSSFSNYGNWISVAAPGESVLTTTKGGGYTYKSGTSFSTPVVAGVAALALAADPSLTAQELVDLIQQTADDLGTAGFDPYYGWGRVNAQRAISEAGGSPEPPGGEDTAPPAVVISSPADNSSVNKRVTINASATDDVGVTGMALYINNSLVAQSSSGSVKYRWRPSVGQHVITATGWDASGNLTQKTIVVARN